LSCSEELQGPRIDFVKFTIQVYYSNRGENGKKIQISLDLGGEARKLKQEAHPPVYQPAHASPLGVAAKRNLVSLKE
jgi:hypothetical protein